MRVITEIKYEANNGSTFNTEQECKLYEELLTSVTKRKKLNTLAWVTGNPEICAGFVQAHYEEIKQIMEDTPEVKPEVDWSKVPEGTVILVKDYPHEDWVVERKFLFRDAHGRFACVHSCGRPKVVAYWSMAKLKN